MGRKIGQNSENHPGAWARFEGMLKQPCLGFDFRDVILALSMVRIAK
jgi:hypothetical protein